MLLLAIEQDINQGVAALKTMQWRQVFV